CFVCTWSAPVREALGGATSCPRVLCPTIVPETLEERCALTACRHGPPHVRAGSPAAWTTLSGGGQAWAPPPSWEVALTEASRREMALETLESALCFLCRLLVPPP
ncbi:mCG1036954, isoform CRA_a, partial [Mus musculus]